MARPVRCRDRWRIRWTDHIGRRRSAMFERFEEAQYALQRYQAEAREVRRGLRVAPPPEHTFGELCDYWVKHRLPSRRSPKDIESIVRKHLRPSFGELPLRLISIEDVDSFVAERRYLTDKTIHNLLTLLVTLLRTAVELGWLHQVPRLRKPRIQVVDTNYRWLKTPEEIARLLTAAREEGEDVHDLYALAIYTGLRQGEIAGLRWSDISLGRRMITVERSFCSPTKSGRARPVPILDPLLPILQRRHRRSQGNVLVFPNARGHMHLNGASVFRETLHRLVDAAAFQETQDVGGHRRRYIVFHSLRHTFASHWMMNGGDLFKLQKVLGHASVEMTQRYAHLAPDAFEDDYSLFGAASVQSRGVPDMPMAKVIPFRASR
ncbi:MAG: site-specific integrase [Pseudomonadota bacterium]